MICFTVKMLLPPCKNCGAFCASSEPAYEWKEWIEYKHAFMEVGLNFEEFKGKRNSECVQKMALTIPALVRLQGTKGSSAYPWCSQEGWGKFLRNFVELYDMMNKHPDWILEVSGWEQKGIWR